jgi:hypothetical protein
MPDTSRRPRLDKVPLVPPANIALAVPADKSRSRPKPVADRPPNHLRPSRPHCAFRAGAGRWRRDFRSPAFSCPTRVVATQRTTVAEPSECCGRHRVVLHFGGARRDAARLLTTPSTGCSGVPRDKPRARRTSHPPSGGPPVTQCATARSHLPAGRSLARSPPPDVHGMIRCTGGHGRVVVHHDRPPSPLVKQSGSSPSASTPRRRRQQSAVLINPACTPLRCRRTLHRRWSTRPHPRTRHNATPAAAAPSRRRENIGHRGLEHPSLDVSLWNMNPIRHCGHAQLSRHPHSSRRINARRPYQAPNMFITCSAATPRPQLPCTPLPELQFYRTRVTSTPSPLLIFVFSMTGRGPLRSRHLQPPAVTRKHES